MVLVLLEKKIPTSVSQGSMLAPFLFIIDVNDLPHDISSSCKMFTDDTSIFQK